MPEETLEGKITRLVNTVIAKMATLVTLHNSSNQSHSDIRTAVNSKSPNDHVHGSITNDGKVGTAAHKPLITGTGGAVQAGKFEDNILNIKMNSGANGQVGVLNTFARADHIHPTDTSRASTATATTAENGLMSKQDKAIVDGISSTYATKAELTNVTNGGVNLVGYVKNSDVVNNLTSNGTDVPLSAKQGKELKALIDGKANQTHYHTFIGSAIASSSNGKVYTASVTGVTATHGLVIALLNNKSDTSNQENATLNVNNLGAKPIYYKNRALQAGEFAYRSLSLFMYVTWDSFNAGNGAWILLDDHDSDLDTTYTASTLTDPVAHNKSISTAVNATQSAINTALDTQLADHGHGGINKAGQIGSEANKPLITSTNGLISVGSFGTDPYTFCQGNDPRLSDARTPTSHTHRKNDISDFTHTHGSLSYTGALTATANTISKIAVTDGSNLLKVVDMIPFSKLDISKDDIVGLGIPSEDTNTTYTPESSASNIKMNGTASAGQSDNYARADHIHPSDTSKADNITATTSANGLLSYQDKIKIDNLKAVATTGTYSSLTGIPNTFTPSSHAHGSIQDGGTITATASSTNKVLVTDGNNNIKVVDVLPANKVTHQNISGKFDTAGTGLTSSGTTVSANIGNSLNRDSNKLVACNDDRLVNARTPTAHTDSGNGNTYGRASGSVFGHVKLSDSTSTSANDAAAGIAASGKAIASTYSKLEDLEDNYNLSDDIRIRLIRLKSTGNGGTTVYSQDTYDSYEGAQLKVNQGDRLGVKVISQSGQVSVDNNIEVTFGLVGNVNAVKHTVLTSGSNGMTSGEANTIGLNNGTNTLAFAIVKGDNQYHRKAIDLAYIVYNS